MVSKMEFNDQCITYSQMNLIFNARIFWRRLTTWTRVYLISRYSGIGSSEELFGRLYLESGDFGDMFRIIFGREISDRVNQLLNQYTIALRELVDAQLNGNDAGMRQSVDSLYQNASQRAAFLESINPYWSESEWQYYLDTYLKLTIEEANSFVTKDYSKDIELFDRLTELTNQIGDYFAQGLYAYITSGSSGSLTNEELTAMEGSDTILQHCFTAEEVNEIYTIRMFWFELVTWVRAYMLSRYENIGNVKEIYARLQKVPADYVNMLTGIFGSVAAEDYIQLFNNYIKLIDSYITAQLNGNIDEINRLTQELYKNADARAEFIASINPYWDVNQWRSRLYNNLRSTIDESSSFLSGDFARNIDIFSTLLSQAESTSDYFAQGLVNYLYVQKHPQQGQQQQPQQGQQQQPPQGKQPQPQQGQ